MANTPQQLSYYYLAFKSENHKVLLSPSNNTFSKPCCYQQQRALSHLKSVTYYVMNKTHWNNTPPRFVTQMDFPPFSLLFLPLGCVIRQM